MTFPERAVESCRNAMSRGRVSQRHIRDVLKFDDIDVSSLESFLNSDNEFVRRGAIQIVGAHGDMTKLVALAKVEKDRSMLMQIIDAFMERPDGVEKIVDLLELDDDMVFENTIDMFRRVGRADCLFGLVFSRDRELVERIKRYINEQRKTSGS